MAEVVLAIGELFFEDKNNAETDVVHLHLCARKNANVLESALISSTVRSEKTRVPGYVETVCRQYSIDDFKDRFRMNRDTFEKFVDVMSPFMRKAQITAEKKLLVFVKYLATQMTFQNLADIFGVCETTVHSIIHDLANITCTKLMPNLIRWPAGNKIKHVVDDFQLLAGFPGVIGAIDGSHIPIRTPSEFPENYFNRKKYPSIVLQAVCDSKLNFTDVFCGWPGSVHDSRILKNSPLMEKIESDFALTFPANTHLLGDSAYSLANWMMVPFKDFGNLSKEQKRYNYVHSSSRMCIERSFGALKGRFRRLKFVDLKDLPCTVQIILSCCTIHQLCMECSDDVLDYINEGMADVVEVNNFEDFMPRNPSAVQKRNTIVCTLK